MNEVIKVLCSFGLSEFEAIALVKMLMASAFGAVIGFEREMKGRPAGLKTFSLVCLGAALVMITNDFICQYITHGTGDMARMAAQVISGIGFLGAGSIMVTGHNQVRGLTTAAALWVTAALGITIGAGFYYGGICGIVVVYCSSILYRFCDKKIMEYSRVMKLYIEGINENFMLELVEHFKQKKIKVLMLERRSENKWYSKDTCVIVELDFGTRMRHKILLDYIRQMDGILYVEEI